MYSLRRSCLYLQHSSVSLTWGDIDMMKRAPAVWAVVLFVGTIFAASSFAGSFGVNITVFDKVGSGSGWYGAQEDQEVEPGMVYTQAWDLEGFFLKGDMLSMIGGFNFRNGVLDDGHTFVSGDIFIDINGDANYGDPNFNPGNTEPISNSLYKWDYVIQLPKNSSDPATYNVYAIGDTAQLNPVYYFPGAYNRASNPWTYSSGGTLLDSGSFSYSSYTQNNGSDPSGSSLQGASAADPHYVVGGFDLSFLPSGTDFTAHFTMECGNDNLIGQGTTAPEPATLVLLGIGLAGLAGFARFSKRN